MATLHVRVGGMHCSLCTRSIERALGRLEGVEEVRVSLAHEEVLVRYDPVRVPVAVLTETLRDLGFSVRDPDRADVFAEEERELARARRIAAATGGLVAAATLLMVAARLGAAQPVRPALLVAQAAHALVASYGLASRNVVLALGFNATGVLASLSGLVHPMWAMLAMAASLTVVLGHTLTARLPRAGQGA